MVFDVEEAWGLMLIRHLWDDDEVRVPHLVHA